MNELTVEMVKLGQSCFSKVNKPLSKFTWSVKRNSFPMPINLRSNAYGSSDHKVYNYVNRLLS